jgi:hypothetical protein
METKDPISDDDSKQMNFFDSVIQMAKARGNKSTRMFMCPYGHLQYNYSREELQDAGFKPLPDTYEGDSCRSGCVGVKVSQLTSDPFDLQQKLSTALMALTQLRLNEVPLIAIRKDMDEIAMFLRTEYQYEINAGLHERPTAKIVIDYLKRERARPVVRFARIMRAVKRILGI